MLTLTQGFLCAGHCPAFPALRGGWALTPPLSDEEARTQRGEVMCFRLHSLSPVSLTGCSHWVPAFSGPGALTASLDMSPDVALGIVPGTVVAESVLDVAGWWGGVPVSGRQQ